MVLNELILPLNLQHEIKVYISSVNYYLTS